MQISWEQTDFLGSEILPTTPKQQHSSHSLSESGTNGMGIEFLCQDEAAHRRFWGWAPWRMQGTQRGDTGMMPSCAVTTQALLSHLSCFDVLQSSEMQQEVVLWEGCLSVGDAAVVTCGQHNLFATCLNGSWKHIPSECTQGRIGHATAGQGARGH